MSEICDLNPGDPLFAVAKSYAAILGDSCCWVCADEGEEGTAPAGELVVAVVDSPLRGAADAIAEAARRALEERRAFFAALEDAVVGIAPITAVDDRAMFAATAAEELDEPDEIEWVLLVAVFPGGIPPERIEWPHLDLGGADLVFPSGDFTIYIVCLEGESHVVAARAVDRPGDVVPDLLLHLKDAAERSADRLTVCECGEARLPGI